jgi:hypothetical protein
MRILLATLLCFVASTALAQKNCLETAREISPQLSTETRRDFETKLAQARADFEENPRDADRLFEPRAAGDISEAAMWARDAVRR